MTENEIVEYVQNNARYLGEQDEPYAVLFQGESLWGESPRELVEQIMDIING